MPRIATSYDRSIVKRVVVSLLVSWVVGGWASVALAADTYGSWPGSNGRLLIQVTDPPGCCNEAIYSILSANEALEEFTVRGCNHRPPS